MLYHFFGYLAGVTRQPRWVKVYGAVEATRLLVRRGGCTDRPAGWLGAAALGFPTFDGSRTGCCALLGSFISLHLRYGDFGLHQNALALKRDPADVAYAEAAVPALGSIPSVRVSEGLGNRLIMQDGPGLETGPIECRRRLGGMLNYYYRRAA